MPPPPSSPARRLHLLATGLLALMAGLYVLGRSLEGHHAAFGFLRAFAEAGMVGALADWFAIVALFRHPMGIPIPHTAIIPRRKDQIADSLARFVEENFLGPAQISAKLAQLGLVRRAAAWLTPPGHAELAAEKLTGLLPIVLDSLDDRDVKRFLRESLAAQARRLPLAPLGSRLLRLLVESGHHQELFTEILRAAKALLAGNVEFVEERIANELRKVPGIFGLRSMLVKGTAKKVVSNIQNSLDEILGHPEHRIRGQFDGKARELLEDMLASPRWEARAEALKDELLSNEALLGSFEAVWDGLKEWLEEDLAHEDSAVKAELARALRELGHQLERDEALAGKLEARLLEAAEYFTRSHGHEIGNLFRETVGRWDGAQLAEKLEAQVGADLQYIRINGTLVGGLIGIALHAIGLLFWK